MSGRGSGSERDIAQILQQRILDEAETAKPRELYDLISAYSKVREWATQSEESVTIPPTFELYIQQLQRPMEPFQWEDFALVLSENQPQVMWCRARGGSKTFDAVTLIVWEALQGKDCAWRSGGDDQLEQPRKYFRENPFVEKVTQYEVTLVTGATISLGPLTAKRSHSLRADFIVLDEIRDMDQTQFEEFHGTLTSKSTNTKQVLYCSTLALGTPAEYIYDTLMPLGLVSIRKWDEIAFEDRDALEMLRGSLPGWFWKLNYECELVPAGGSVFENITRAELPDKLKKHDVMAGLDFNGSVGHVLVAAVFDSGNIWVVDEKIFTGTVDGAKAAVEYARSHHYDLEIEEGGFNDKFANQLPSVPKMRFTVASKEERIGRLLAKHIYVSDSCPDTLKDLKRAAWASDGKVAKDPKDSSHWLDALQHAAHFKLGPIKFIDEPTTHRGNWLESHLGVNHYDSLR